MKFTLNRSSSMMNTVEQQCDGVLMNTLHFVGSLSKLESSVHQPTSLLLSSANISWSPYLSKLNKTADLAQNLDT